MLRCSRLQNHTGWPEFEKLVDHGICLLEVYTAVKGNQNCLALRKVTSAEDLKASLKGLGETDVLERIEVVGKEAGWVAVDWFKGVKEIRIVLI